MKIKEVYEGMGGGACASSTCLASERFYKISLKKKAYELSWWHNHTNKRTTSNNFKIQYFDYLLLVGCGLTTK
jgi:hypothetical protein